jgi:hypothetical protein
MRLVIIELKHNEHVRWGVMRADQTSKRPLVYGSGPTKEEAIHDFWKRALPEDIQ